MNVNYQIITEKGYTPIETGPWTFENEGGFRIEISEEEELRMSMWASTFQVFDHGKNLTSELLGRQYWGMKPPIYEPFSSGKLFAFIPSRFIEKDSSPLLIQTNSKRVIRLPKWGAIRANLFAHDKNLLLITSYPEGVFLTDYITQESRMILKTKGDWGGCFAWFSMDEERIIILHDDQKSGDQKVTFYALDGKKTDEISLKLPETIFSFNAGDYEDLQKPAKFHLFLDGSTSKLASSQLFNQWQFDGYSRKTGEIRLRTVVPQSEIYTPSGLREKGSDAVLRKIEISVS